MSPHHYLIPKEALEELEGYDFLLPNSPNYESSLNRWFASSIRPAGVVFFPRSAEEGAFAFRWATKHNVEPVIRGGGHSVSGASSTDGGIVIDLSRHLNTVHIDPAKKIAYVGGGCIWKQVDAEAIKYGLATPSGIFNDTGVGGLVTGGGMGYLTGLFGLSCDNIIGGTIVLPSGSVINSLQEDPDLLWAIRGGGAGAFGCVTEFQLNLHEVPRNVSIGMGFFAPDKVPELIPKIERFLKVRSNKDTGGLFLLVQPDATSVAAWVATHIGPKNEAESVHLDILSSAQKTVHPELIAEVPFEEMNELMHPYLERNLHVYFSSAFHSGPPGEVIRKTFENYMAVNGDLLRDSSVTALNQEIMFHGWGKASLVKDSVLAQRGPDQTFVAAIVTYKPEFGDKGLAAARAIATQAREVFASDGGAGGYPNLDRMLANTSSKSSGDDDGVEATANRNKRAVEILGSENLKRLRDIKRRVDPKGVLKNWFGA